MALTQLNQLAIAFKKLAGKAHTNSSFGIGNEAIASFVQLGTTTLFGEPIPTTSLPSSLYGINGPIEKVRFSLEQIDLSQYQASNPGGLTGATINASGDGAPRTPTPVFTNGIHAYKLKLPSDYQSNSSNPKAGTSPFTNNSIISDSAGGLQLIPNSFAAGYAAVVYDSTGQIAPGDEDDYYVDYSTGILFIQDVVSGQPPIYVDAYLYVGKYLADPTLSYSGSFSGSFQGDGAGLTNVPASGVVGLNLTQIATTDITASVQESGNIFTVTSASQEVFNISDQGILSGSGANLFDIPASGITGLNLSRVATGSVTASVDVGATSFTVESGSSTLMTVNPDGRIAVSKSINAGVPNLNPWGTGLEGSYFNNFDSTSDVSDILRFVAGLLSASAPDAAPNTRTWESTNVDFQSTSTVRSRSQYMTGVLGGSTIYRDARLAQEWNQSNVININATGSYRNLQSYLISKGWMNSSETGSQALHDVGTHPFGTEDYGNSIPITNIYTTNFSNFTFNVDSSVGSSTTTFSSSIGPQAFGLGRLINVSTPTPYSLRLLYTQSFSDNASDKNPGVSSTYSTGSVRLYTQATAGSTANGLYLGIIETGNDLIPNAFQDARFLDTPASFATRKWGDTGITGDVTSSIGFYKLHGISVGISSSLQSGFVTQSPTSVLNTFYMPSLGTLGVGDITLTPPTVGILGNANITAFTATSRSLSGAPYLLTTTYTVEYNTEVSKSFDPCYGFLTDPITVTTPTNQWENIGSTTLNDTSVSIDTTGVQTSTAKAGVFPAGTSPASKRDSGEIPAIGDVAFLSSSVTFSLDNSFNNTTVSRSIQENLNYDLIFRTTGKNWKKSAQTLDSSTLEFYDATRFGQPSLSGSMAIYSFAQATTFGSLTGTTEEFKGENFRIQVSSSGYQVTAFNGAPWDTGEAYYNLKDNELQVKPGYLVKPGGTFGYWLPNPSSASDYKYYIRRFRNTSDVKSIRITINQDLAIWNSTTDDSVAMGIIFESARSGSTDIGGGNCRLYDVGQGGGSAGLTFPAYTDGTNPFENPLNFYRAGSKPSSTTGIYDVAISNANGIFMDGSSTRDEFYLIIRYKGDPSPLTGITLTYTT